MPWKEWVLLWVFACSFALHAEAGGVLEFEVRPGPADNFIEASFRCRLPEEVDSPEAWLVILHGTDSDAREAVRDPGILAAAKSCRAAVIGVYFRGEGLAYDSPNGGSGQALERAADFFAEKLGQRSLRAAPFFIWGHSAGAQFAYNFAAWKPARVKAFAAIKAGGFALSAQEDSYRVPGLIGIGQKDEGGRIRTGVEAFLAAQGKNSEWCFLQERDSGHEPGRSGALALEFFKELCRKDPPEAQIWNAETGEKAKEAERRSPPACWMPSESFAESWKALHRAGDLTRLRQSPDRLQLRDLITVTGLPEQFSCRGGETVTGIIRLESKAKGNVVLSAPALRKGCFWVVRKSAPNVLPMELAVTFQPGDRPWGTVVESLRMGGKAEDNDLEPLEISLRGRVEGGVEAFPSLLYFGAGVEGKDLTKMVRLRSKGGGINMVKIRTKPENELSVKSGPPESDVLNLEVKWKPSSRLGSMAGEIWVEFDRPEKGSLRIQVLGWVGRNGN